LKATKFPYCDAVFYPNDDAKANVWVAALERTGPENVRARLAQTDAGSPGAISIGTVQSMTIGFAQEWLAWRDRLKSENEDGFRGRQIFWTRWAALAATIAAGATAIRWLYTLLHPR
jgi:hypothetical protein